MTIVFLLLGLVIALGVVSQTQRLVWAAQALQTLGGAVLGLLVAVAVFAALTAIVDRL